MFDFSKDGAHKPTIPEVGYTPYDAAMEPMSAVATGDKAVFIAQAQKALKGMFPSRDKEGGFTVRGDKKWTYKWDGDKLLAKKNNGGWLNVDTSKISREWEGHLLKPHQAPKAKPTATKSTETVASGSPMRVPAIDNIDNSKFAGAYNSNYRGTEDEAERAAIGSAGVGVSEALSTFVSLASVIPSIKAMIQKSPAAIRAAKSLYPEAGARTPKVPGAEGSVLDWGDEAIDMQRLTGGVTR